MRVKRVREDGIRQVSRVSRDRLAQPALFFARPSSPPDCPPLLCARRRYRHDTRNHTSEGSLSHDFRSPVPGVTHSANRLAESSNISGNNKGEGRRKSASLYVDKISSSLSKISRERKESWPSLFKIQVGKISRVQRARLYRARVRVFARVTRSFIQSETRNLSYRRALTFKIRNRRLIAAAPRRRRCKRPASVRATDSGAARVAATVFFPSARSR